MNLSAMLMPSLVALAIAAGGCAKESDEARPKLRLGNVPWPGWAALDVGLEKGFFREEGVDVEIVQFGVSGDQQLIDAIASGEVDGGFYMLGALLNNALERGQPITYLGAVDWSYGGDQIVIRPPLETSIAAIQSGQRQVGTYSTAASTLLLLDLYFRDTSRHSWSFSIGDVAVTERPAEDLVASFKAGEEPVSLNFDPVIYDQIAAGGEVVATSATYPGVISEGLMVSTPLYQGANKAAYAALLRGWVRAVEYMYGEGHRLNVLNAARADEVVEIVQRRTFLGDGTSKEDVLSSLANVRVFSRAKLEAVNLDEREDVRLAEYPTKGVQPLRSHLRELDEFIRALNPAAAPLQAQVTVDLEPLRTALAQLATR
ncbi:MAG TPA: ABC transporter substrate-binding protein [Polyangiaceae bacterium]|nr:ABC transporter substrate-binding protein [Polyangiaceae bacterium]